jgi:hypothetical protein
LVSLRLIRRLKLAFFKDDLQNGGDNVLYGLIENILNQDPLSTASSGFEIGKSREGRSIEAHKFGNGPRILSLIGGCHADEPTGPLLLKKLSHFLNSLPPESPILTKYSWHLIPHTNPDGESVNRAWYRGDEEVFDFKLFAEHRRREAPGEDLEFGFPHNANDTAARPEAQAIYAWWRSLNTTFDFHISLHGMAVAEGPWFLVEPAWIGRITRLKQECRAEVLDMGYQLFDWDRKGEKGFHHLEKGFSTRPNSQAMKRYFIERNDSEMAERFRPSSMECIRSLGGNPLTLVSEMPLFIGNLSKAKANKPEQPFPPEAMPLKDQMRLQWRFICSGLSCLD